MKRRIRRIRRALKRAGLYNVFHITLIAVLLTGFCVILFNVKEPEQQEKEPEEIQAEVMQNPETMTQTAENIEDKYKVFDTMSEDWGSDDLEGFVFYDLPEQYADKGYFPEKMQIYTRCLCKQYDVPYALVLAIIEQESGYEFDKTGDGGQSKGYMQIYEKWHTDRMQALQIAQDTQNTIDAAEAVRQAQERLREAAEKAREIKESRREDDTAKAIAKCVEAMEAAIEQTKKCLTATEEANKIIISQSGLDAILAAVKDYYERIRELETDININVDGGTPKSTDLLLVKGGTPFTTDYDKYIAGTSHTI